MNIKNDDYEWSVFINCPFDKQYEPIFHAIIFAVIDCGYIARSAQESSDSGEIRIQKIVKLIENSDLQFTIFHVHILVLKKSCLDLICHWN